MQGPLHMARHLVPDALGEATDCMVRLPPLATEFHVDKAVESAIRSLRLNGFQVGRRRDGVCIRGSLDCVYSQR